MSNQNNSSTSAGWCDSQCWSFLGFRLFLAFRWLFAGLDKFELDGTYSFANYYVNMDRMATGIAGSSILPLWSTKIFALPSGYLMLLLGLTILLGIKIRLSLIVSLFLYLGLTVGMMAVNENSGIAWLAIHLLISVMALQMANSAKWVLWKD